MLDFSNIADFIDVGKIATDSNQPPGGPHMKPPIFWVINAALAGSALAFAGCSDHASEHGPRGLESEQLGGPTNGKKPFRKGVFSALAVEGDETDGDDDDTAGDDLAGADEPAGAATPSAVKQEPEHAAAAAAPPTFADADGADNSLNIKRVQDAFRAHGRVLVMVRGPSGSGKSFLAEQVKKAFKPGQVAVFTTDDYFMGVADDGVTPQYRFDVTKLAQYHEDNAAAADAAMAARTPVVVVPNSNIELWEMQSYVRAAKNHGYHVMFIEPNTPWRGDPALLRARTAHDVPAKVIGDKVRQVLKVPTDKITFQDVIRARKPNFAKKPTGK